MVYATCLRILGNSADAEDVTQECFQVLALTSEGPREHLAGWLHSVATNRSLKRIRGEKRRKRREAEFASLYETHGQIEWDDIYEQVDQAIEDLPEELRIPVVAHFLQGESHAAIAEKLGLSRRGVTHRIGKGLELIRKAFKRRGILVGTGALAAVMKGSSAAAAPSTLATAIGKLAIAASMPPGTTGMVSGTAGAASELAVYGGIVVMTKKALIVLGVLAVVLGGSYLLVAPKRGPVSERETVGTARPAERALRPSSGEAEDKGPGTSRRDVGDSGERYSREVGRAGAERVEPESDSLAPWLEKLTDALKRTREQEEEELEPVRPSDIPLDNGAHYFLLAAELFPEVDGDWLKEKLAEIRATGATDDPKLLAFLAACQEAFDAVRQGLAVGNAELPPGRHGFAEPLPYLPAYRNLAYAMSVEAAMLAAQGDYQGAFAMYDALMDFGTESGRGGFIINGIVGYNIQGIAIESLSYAIESGWATPDEYRFLIEQLYAADARQYRVSEAMMAEARNLAVWVDRVTQEGEAVFAAEFEKTFAGIKGFQPGMTAAEMESLYRKMLTDYERMAEYLALPFYEAQLVDANSFLADNWMAQADDRVARCNGAEARMAASVRGVMVMAAVELYRAEHASYPATLTQLVPDYLQALPEDPFTGSGFGYAAGSNDYLLYSFGPDMEDDGGITVDPTGRFETWEGDWVIHGEKVSIR